MSGAKRFLMRLEEKTAFRACVFAALLMLMAGTMFLLNAHTPLQMDDYDYSFSWSTGKPLSGVADVLASQAAHYRLWGGRSVVHTLAQLFLYAGKAVFNAANTVMYVLLVLELYALAKPKGRRFCWPVLLTIHAALFTLVPFFGTVFLWLDGACNYLWGTTLALLPLLLVPKLTDGKKHAASGIIAVPIAFLSGWTNENAACGVLAAVFCLLADKMRRKEHVPLAAWLCLAAQAAGAAVMILAPGNFVRASAYAYDSMALEMLKRVIRVTLYTVVYAGVLLSAVPLVGAAGRALGVPVRGRKTAWLLLAALLSAYAMAASPELSDRSYTCVIALTLSALATIIGDIDAHVRALDAAKLCALPLALMLLVFDGCRALQDVSAHEAAWNAQLAKIEQAAAAGETSVTVDSVESRSRFTTSIVLERDAGAWPNSTLSKWFGVAVNGD